ncbi:MAG TPA: hypothetical protein VFP65_14340 [Anaeromyxobacteraceae bacterium]|nr:hypothetical protein [Anaeromyxobacteraceae bacterium]
MRLRLTVLLASGALALASCATAASMRRERLQRELDAFAYAKPLDEVWQEGRRMLAERGFPLADKDAEAVGQKPMSWAEKILSPARETGPATEGGLLQRMGVVKGRNLSGAAQALDTGWSQYGERYHLEGLAEGTGSRVLFTFIKQGSDRQETKSRDLEMELDLMRRVDPEAAERIDRAADAPGR